MREKIEWDVKPKNLRRVLRVLRIKEYVNMSLKKNKDFKN